MAAMKGRMANKYYALAEEAYAQVQLLNPSSLQYYLRQKRLFLTQYSKGYRTFKFLFSSRESISEFLIAHFSKYILELS